MALTCVNDPEVIEVLKSKIHLLARPGIFDQLRCIDLSDNDIYDLLTVVQSLSSLQQLSSLQLEGNPCSVCESYKDVIFKFLPNLLYLDNTEPMEQDKITSYLNSYQISYTWITQSQWSKIKL
ncbi:hypothetical protein QE152_g15419 [Popillia japonica]|uniref:Uncharacterized protein n=1 Tax=Popillia japonica TaxID=7064 RepID=A0AAW1L7Y9_POPJA